MREFASNMAVFRLVGLDHYRGTRPGLIDPWRRGVERELPDESALYMLDAFPGAIEPAEPTALHSAVDAPPNDRALRSPRGRR